MPKPVPSQDLLQELFDYDKTTGELTNKVFRTHNAPVGASAISWSFDQKGQRRGVVWMGKKHGGRFPAARIIWSWMTGEDPGDLFVDHINRDPSDNRWANLRLATRSQNGANSVRREKPHGRGVYLCRKKGYPDRLLVYCGSEYQGNYPTSQLKEAQELFEKRYKEKFGEFAVSL